MKKPRKMRMTGCRLFPGFKNSSDTKDIHVLPSPHVFVLDSSDSIFVKKHFPMPNTNLTNLNIKDSDELRFVCKVTGIGKVEKSAGRSFQVLDVVKGKPANLFLKVTLIDHLVNVSRLFKLGDILCFSSLETGTSFDAKNPRFGTKSNTTFLVLPRDSSVFSSRKQIRSPLSLSLSSSLSSSLLSSSWVYSKSVRLDSGLYDTKYVRSRITIHDLVPNLTNVSLLARLEKVFMGDSETMLLLKDDTGMTKLHVKKSLISKKVQLREGQILFLEGLDTIDEKPIDVKYDNARTIEEEKEKLSQGGNKRKRNELDDNIDDSGNIKTMREENRVLLTSSTETSITILSSMVGLLTSSCLLKLCILSSLSLETQNAIASVKIIKVTTHTGPDRATTHTGPATHTGHTTHTGPDQATAHTPPEPEQTNFNFIWSLMSYQGKEDESDNAVIYSAITTDYINSIILGYSWQDFQNKSTKEQKQILDETIGKSYVVFLSQFKGIYFIEQIANINYEVEQKLEQLFTKNNAEVCVK
eukprot:TRINITY_DN2446_c0_g1_i3.p1 TRINITY_DN2446_c0_g1~~TRINITY_DN2446_c0_g1_i3.p1  ORF type:complete len:527 (-),score=73.74 TRINITY_DN2446_c0_g1_i3:159-1739(-)